MAWSEAAIIQRDPQGEHRKSNFQKNLPFVPSGEHTQKVPGTVSVPGIICNLQFS